VKIAKCFTLFGMVLLTFNANSTEYIKTTAIAKIVAEGARPGFPDVEHRDFLELVNVDEWAGGGSGCHSNTVVIPDGKTFMRSIALAAVASGKPVEVRIDNTLPKIMNTYCQITVLSIAK
jgi:hypothetical protein